MLKPSEGSINSEFMCLYFYYLTNCIIISSPLEGWRFAETTGWIGMLKIRRILTIIEEII